MNLNVWTVRHLNQLHEPVRHLIQLHELWGIWISCTDQCLQDTGPCSWFRYDLVQVSSRHWITRLVQIRPGPSPTSAKSMP